MNPKPSRRQTAPPPPPPATGDADPRRVHRRPYLLAGAAVVYFVWLAYLGFVAWSAR
jgi:hypothetical protein